VKVDSIKEIMGRGVMMTPGLFIDGESKAMGRVHNVEEIKRLLKKRLSNIELTQAGRGRLFGLTHSYKAISEAMRYLQQRGQRIPQLG
jgi:predicted thioredoxin/glutaredoxin